MSILELFGWFGSALLVIGVMQARLIRLRLLNLAASLVLVVYNALIEVWPMTAMNVVLVVIHGYFLVQLLRDRHDDAAFDVVEVAPTDDYLRHVLRVHEADILRYQPGFLWDGAEPGHRSFIVMRGDETVGVVLLRDEGAGTAQVVLDYVTPRFRDFSPGEFVWRRSDLLRSSGFNRVITPSDMVNPYYARLDFKPAGRSFVLDL